MGKQFDAQTFNDAIDQGHLGAVGLRAEIAQDEVDRCEMCGAIKDVDQPAQYDAQEVMTWLISLWVEHPHAPAFLLARLGFPDWSYAQIAKTMKVTKSEVGKVASFLHDLHPELDDILHRFRGTARHLAGWQGRRNISKAQRERRQAERLQA